jgi:2-polyprenyl-3-methyl-5-hydroxy-6-metoxy-1,4-benzoquinol methylase
MVLDCGCAAGGLLLLLRRHGYSNIKGIDVSPELLSHLPAPLKGDVLCHDVLGMSDVLAHGAFDVVTALNLQHHIGREPQWDSFIGECRKVLKAGGLLMLREPYPTLMFRGLMCLAGCKPMFSIRALETRLKDIIAERPILDYFFERWPSYYRGGLSRNRFEVVKELSWMGHRIVVARAL